MKRTDETLIKETLAKNHTCYVLLTCDESKTDGEMKVEMSYEGDATLAAYMLHGAQNFMDDKVEEDALDNPPDIFRYTR